MVQVLHIHNRFLSTGFAVILNAYSGVETFASLRQKNSKGRGASSAPLFSRPEGSCSLWTPASLPPRCAPRPFRRGGKESERSLSAFPDRALRLSPLVLNHQRHCWRVTRVVSPGRTVTGVWPSGPHEEESPFGPRAVVTRCRLWLPGGARGIVNRPCVSLSTW